MSRRRGALMISLSLLAIAALITVPVSAHRGLDPDLDLSHIYVNYVNVSAEKYPLESPEESPSLTIPQGETRSFYFQVASHPHCNMWMLVKSDNNPVAQVEQQGKCEKNPGVGPGGGGTQRHLHIAWGKR